MPKATNCCPVASTSTRATVPSSMWNSLVCTLSNGASVRKASRIFGARPIREAGDMPSISVAMQVSRWAWSRSSTSISTPTNSPQSRPVLVQLRCAFVQRAISASSALAQTVSQPFIIGRLPAPFMATCAPSTGIGR